MKVVLVIASLLLLQQAYANWLSETFTKLGDEFETAYKEHKPEIEELVKDVKHEVSKTSKKFKKLVEKGKEVHENVADEIKDTVKKAAQKFKEKLPNDIPGKKKEIIRKWVKLVQQFSPVDGEKIKAKIPETIKKITDMDVKKYVDISDIEDWKAKVASKFEDAGEKVGLEFGKVIDGMQENMKEVQENMKHKMEESFSGMKPQEILEKIKTSDATKHVKNMMKESVVKAKKMAKHLGESVQEHLKMLFQDIEKTTSSEELKSLLDQLDNVNKAIKAKLNAVFNREAAEKEFEEDGGDDEEYEDEEDEDWIVEDEDEDEVNPMNEKEVEAFVKSHFVKPHKMGVNPFKKVLEAYGGERPKHVHPKTWDQLVQMEKTARKDEKVKQTDNKEKKEELPVEEEKKGEFVEESVKDDEAEKNWEKAMRKEAKHLLKKLQPADAFVLPSKEGTEKDQAMEKIVEELKADSSGDDEDGEDDDDEDLFWEEAEEDAEESPKIPLEPKTIENTKEKLVKEAKETMKKKSDIEMEKKAGVKVGMMTGNEDWKKFSEEVGEEVDVKEEDPFEEYEKGMDEEEDAVDDMVEMKPVDESSKKSFKEKMIKDLKFAKLLAKEEGDWYNIKKKLQAKMKRLITNKLVEGKKE